MRTSVINFLINVPSFKGKKKKTKMFIEEKNNQEAINHYDLIKKSGGLSLSNINDQDSGENFIFRSSIRFI